MAIFTVKINCPWTYQCFI